jgi:thymidylate synthase (FAD)
MKAELIDHMGDDLSVVNAARVSFDKVSEWEDFTTDYENVLKDKDAALIRYLSQHDHWTPFAHTAVTLRMQAPVPIRTQCFKHKVGMVENEESRRYISSTPTLYVPDVFRNAPLGSVKQGSSGEHYDSARWRDAYIQNATMMISLYSKMVADGVCTEQARFMLPQGCEVNWVWTGNVLAFARFVNMRTSAYAQKEIRDLAQQVGDLIKPLFPVSWAALTAKV